MAEKQKNCYLGISGKKYGPVSEDDIHKLYNDGKITGDTKFIRAGMKEWIALSESGIIMDADGLPPLPQDDGIPPLPPSPTMDNVRTLQNIKKYGANKECKCLECGYSGLMGIVRNATSPGSAIAIALALGILGFGVFAALFFAISAFIGLDYEPMLVSVFLVLIALSVGAWVLHQLLPSLREKKVLFCPNCEIEITER